MTLHRPARAPDTLEDRIYRSSLAEGNRAIGRAGPWLTVPPALAVYGLIGLLVVLVGRGTVAEPRVTRSVAVLLQEPAGAPGPAPAKPRPPAGTPASPTVRQQPMARPAPPPEPPQETVPEVAPRELPREDHSMDFAGPGGSGPADVAGTGLAGGPGGREGGTGWGGGGAQPPRILDVDFTQVREIFRPPPPDYPNLARLARVEGTVVVQILVGTDGVPISARVLSGPLMLRDTAATYAMAWRFAPYLQNGVPRVSRFNLNVSFRIK